MTSAPLVLQTMEMLKIGGRFGDYTVEALLGRGGMGEVYRIRSESGAVFAVKVMKAPEGDGEHEFRRRFAREAEIAMKVNHRNLIKVYDVGEDPETGLCYIIMDYVPGGSVAQKLAAQGKMSIEESLAVTIKIAAALAQAHMAGVVHRDIKPDNIMFDEDGTPKLADLGIAKFEDGREVTQLTSTGVVIGTPAYMAPEQMLDSHNVTPKADIYSLGMVLYEMLSGMRPHGNISLMALMSKVLKGEELRDIRELRPEVPDEVHELVAKMCATDAERRPDDMIAVATACKAALAHLQTGKRGLGTGVRMGIRKLRFSRPTKILVRTGLALAAVAVLVGIGVAIEEMVFPDGKGKMGNAVESGATESGVPAGDGWVEEAREKFSEEARFKFEINGQEVWITGIDGEARPGNLYIPGILADRPVTRIKDQAFANCKWIRNLVVPEGVKQLGVRAFAECKNLETVILPESLEIMVGEAFLRCEELKKVHMPSRMKRLGYGTFAGCANLEQVDIPEGVENIEAWAFSGCRALKRAIVPEGVKSINLRAFSACAALTEATLPDSLTDMVGEVFQNCEMLEKVRLPKRMARLGYGTFAGCGRLAGLELPEGIKALEDWICSNCSSLERIVIPKGVKRIGHTAFMNCVNLESVVIPDGVEWINHHAFCGCRRLKEAEIPLSVERIGEWAFQDCTGLKTVTVPQYACSDKFGKVFASCHGIAEVRVADGVKSIGEGAFASCTGLKSVVLPDTVTKINRYAFGEGGRRDCVLKVSAGKYGRLKLDGEGRWLGMKVEKF